VSLDRWPDIRGGEALKSPHLATHHFGPGLYEQLRTVEHHGRKSTLHLAIHPTLDLLAPDRVAANRRRLGARFDDRSCLRGYIVTQALDESVTRNADWVSRLLTEQ